MEPNVENKMSVRSLRWFSRLVGVGAIIAAATHVAPGCTLPISVVGCMAYGYTTDAGPGGQLSAILDPGPSQTAIPFTPPAVLVSHTSHVAIVNALDAGDTNAPALQALYVHVADATREMCRRTIQDHLDTLPGQPNVMGEVTNCEDYDEAFAQSQLAPGQPVPESEPDLSGAHIQVDPQCHGIDLLGENLSPFGDTDGIDSPEHPLSRVVACQCEVEKVGVCNVAGHYAPDRDGGSGSPPRTIHEKFCLPEGRMPADYCRVDIANYLNGAVRMIAGYQGIELSDPDPNACLQYEPSAVDVVVRCVPEDMDDLDAAEVGTLAWTDQEDECFEGCGSVDCHERLAILGGRLRIRSAAVGVQRGLHRAVVVRLRHSSARLPRGGVHRRRLHSGPRWCWRRK